MGVQLETHILTLSNLHKYKMPSPPPPENEPEVIILPLIGLSKRLVHHLVLDIVVTMSRYARYTKNIQI